MDNFNEGMILPTLIKQLRSILERYPDDGQILKEVIQNAEDAGASKVVFLIDNTTYGTDPKKLHHEGLAQYQGPALYAYNDAVFRNDDWKGIRMLHDSVKADDPMKVGRFGLGFKSVFHMTDLPSVLSGQGVGFIDPHREFFEIQLPGWRSREKTTSFLWHLVSDKEEISRLQHQFEPFIQPLFGVTASTLTSGNFNGTIFRFPFRTKQMKSSDLSRTTYDRDKVKDLVRSLQADAHHMLLFLRNLQSIEVYEKESSQEAKKLLEIRIVPSYLDLVRRQCMEFQRQVKVEWRKEKTVSATYPLAVSVEDYTNRNHVVKETCVWIVSQYYAGAEEGPFVTLSSDKGYLPLVGVALPLDMSVTEPLCKTEPKGHVFCFLPLPLEKKSPTGLQFHVHGSFAIDQNRRHIKWPSADLEMLTLRDDALIWNQFLVKVVLPRAALRLIAYLTELHGSRQASEVPKELMNALQEANRRDPEFTAHLVYAMIPDASCVTTQWKSLSDAIYVALWNLRIFYSRVSGGKWLNCDDAIFDCMDDQSALNKLLRSILNQDQRNLACIPRYIHKHLPNRAKRIAAESVCQSLRNVQHTLPLGGGDREVLLRYIMEHQNQVQNLLGLKLLPLADGNWTEFQRANYAEKVYIDSINHPQKLLPGMERRFLNTKLAPKSVTDLASTGIFQLKILSAADVLEMLCSIFNRWQTLETIQVNREPWLSDKWLSDLWSYLQKNFCQTLSNFENMHILPLGQGAVGKLSRIMPIVSKIDGYNKGETPLHPELITLCKQVGVQVIESIEQEVSKHPGVWNTYILQPSARGVLTALRRQESRIGLQELCKLFDKVSATGKQRFRDFIANFIQNGELTSYDEPLLKSLPMFSTANGSGGEKTYFVSLTKVKRVAPTDHDIPLPSPEVLLDLTDKNCRKIAASLGIRPPSIQDHLVDVYFPAVMNNYFSKDNLSKLMQYVCKNLAKFEQVSVYGIASSASEVTFISKKSDDLVRPSDVYDRSELLSKLFDEEDVFPCGEFAKQEYNKALLTLGLKKADSVTAEEILAIAETLSSSSTTNQAKLKQSEALMAFLNQYGDSILSQHVTDNKRRRPLKSKLSELSWVKISSTRPLNYPSALSLVGEHSTNSLACPTEISASKYVYLVGSSQATLDTTGIASLAKHFDWTSEPRIEYVAEHLLNTILSYDPKQKVAVQYVLVNVYRHLNKNLDLVPSVLYRLEDQAWVWHGDGFARIEQMVLSKQLALDFKPYVYPLPVEISEFQSLWSHCGMEKTCDPVKVLKAIKQAHDDKTDLRNKERDIQLAVNILNKLSKDGISEELRSEIVIPITTSNKKLEMRNIDECTYCDTEWYQHGFKVEDLDDDIFLIHELVPLTTAEKLNIPSLINKTIGAVELAIGYGQTEPLTTRLKTILRDYTDGLAVLKELIQNADDAGASEIRFLYDERRNEDAQTILLDKGMKTLQGPALWTYNDAVFTDEDFDNIVKLSGATKETATEKIGRFGLGFNAVYNITDVPLFISREFIAIFDPHTTHLGRAIPDKKKPGMKLNLRQNRRMIQRLVDQFKPMNGIFGVDLSSDSKMETYDGTLFRFPLRTKEQAAKSDICKICYDHAEIVTLLKLLRDAGHQLLMYTQHVRKITVFHLPESCSPPDGIQEWFSIKKELVKAVRSVGCPNKSKSSSIEAQCAVLQNAANILSGYMNSPTRETPKLESSSILKFTTTQGSNVPFKSKETSEVSEWLVVSTLGRDKSLKLALKERTLIPLGGVAARLQVGKGPQYESVDFTSAGDGYGLLFCFLPLPIKTGFPVHINGFFAVHSSRTHLYETSPMDKTDHRAVWNEALLDDAVTRAYCILLEDLTRLCPESISYVVWPSHSTLKEIGFLGRLTESVYRRVCSLEDCMSVVKTLDSWTTMANCVMLNRQLWNAELREVALSVFRKVLEDQDKYAVDIPEKILQTIQQTSLRSVVENRMVSKVDFYDDWFLPNIRIINPLERDKLILHALGDEELATHLKDSDCIPVTPDGTELQSISELIHPNSRLTALFDGEEGRFPMWTSGVKVEEKIYERLVSLGMRRDSLPWREIVDRCAVISSNPSTAPARTPVILSLIENQLKLKTEKMSSEEAVFGKIRKVKFLPVLKKSKDFPLKWKGDDFPDHELISCEQGFLKSHKNLVSCSCPIIDEKHSFDNSCPITKQKLSLDSPVIDPNVVVQQALEVVRVGECKESNKHLSADGLRILNEIYDDAFKWLDTSLKQDVKPLVKLKVKPLASQNSIMVPSDKHINHFLEPMRCAMKFPLGNDSLLPYLAAVPPSMVRSYPVLLKKIGVKEVFSLSDYIRILEEIKVQSEERDLDQRELGVAIYLITKCIYEEVNSPLADEYTELLNDMPMPNAEGRMCLAKELCFNNCLWLVDATERSKFCHNLISHEIASALGLQTIRQGVLKGHRLGIPFGQKERLVKRIKKILTGYPFSEDILKEMLQNADDSGATEVHFILDTRTLPNKTIFEDCWKPLQGPALCIYNNKSFKKTDLQGIQNLGEGGKSDDPTKTGQYGVGFNCVYHVTDVPTFITTVESFGTILCAFDPNCKFVPDAEVDDPGAMFKDVESLKTKFPDVFKGYLLDQKQYDVSKTGTLFRLPLRNTEMAIESEISQKTVSVTDVSSMFEKFKTDMKEALLFVNSVEQLSLVDVTEGKNGTGSLTTLVYNVSIQMTKESRKLRSAFHRHVIDTATRLVKQEISLKEVVMKEVSYQLEIKDSEKNEEVWQIVQRFGFEDTYNLPMEIVKEVSLGNLGLLPRGGVAYLVKTTKQVERKSRLFCFLPLPVPVDLPVHLNGHFALDHENRRDLWKDENKTYRAEWNRCLMEGVIAPAYCTLLGITRDPIRQLDSYDKARGEMEKYFKLFPMVSKADNSYIKNMTASVYKNIMSKKLEVLPLQSMKKDIKTVEWKNPSGEPGHQVFFDNLESQLPEPPSINTECYRSSGIFKQEAKSPPKETKSSVVRKLLGRCGFSMFSCPVRIFRSFEKAGAEISMVSPESVLEFFATHSKSPTRCKVTNLPQHLSNTPFKDVPSLVALLEYVTKAQNYKDSLEGLPFLLTCDEFVRSFESRQPRYVSPYSGIAPHIPHMFMNLDTYYALKLHSNFDRNLCVEFTTAEFAKVLPDLIPVAEFYDSEGCYPVAGLDGFLHPRGSKAQQWLVMIWCFLQSNLYGKLPEHDKATIQEMLSPLANCCLLPVLVNQSEMLYPMCKSLGVIPLQFGVDITHKDMTEILHKLGVAEPCYKYIRSTTITNEIMRLTDGIFGRVHQPVSVIEALKFLMKNKTLEGKLTNNECSQLMRYFSSTIESVKSLPDGKLTIKALPFFITLYDKQTSLKRSKSYVLPSAIPPNDMENWTEGQDLIFLKQDYSLKTLLEYLDCEFLTVEKAYCSFILKQFERLSPKGQEAHMSYVKDHMQTLNTITKKENKEESDRFLEHLKCLAFIPKNEITGLFPPSQFYDPGNEVFKIMQETHKFPPKPYDKHDWLSILRQCGLVHDLTPEMFIEYAQQVERQAEDGIQELIVQQSNKLVKVLLDWNQPMSPEFLKTVKAIRFVAPGLVNDSLGQLQSQFGERNSNGFLKSIAFQESTLNRHHELIWTVQNILPSWIDLRDKDQKTLKALGVVVTPERKTVALHTEKLCMKYKEESDDKKAIRMGAFQKVLEKIYDFFNRSLPLEEPEKTILSRTPFVFIKETYSLVRPTQIAIDIKSQEDIKPYLHKIPLDFGSFASLFQQLGATKEVTAEQFAVVLKEIADGSQSEKLNVEDRNASRKATAGLLRLIHKGQSVTDDIFLPCTDDKLHCSTEVVCSDNMQLISRIKRFTEPTLIDGEHFGLAHHDLEQILKKLPLRQRTKFISEVVCEVMIESQTVTCAFAEKMTSRLRNPAFLSGFERIIRHCLTAPANISKTGDLDQRSSELLSVLDGFSFLGKHRIQTYLKYNEQQIEGSVKEYLYFFETPMKFHIQSSAVLSEHDFCETLAKAINKAADDLPKNHLLDLSGILWRPMTEIHSYLTRLGIRESGDPRSSFVPPLGTFVPEFDQHLLVQDNFIFHRGQLLALEKDDPFDRGEEGSPVYILVELVERLEPDDPSAPIFSARYKIKVKDDEEIIVKPIQLFTFKRIIGTPTVTQTAVVVRAGSESTEEDYPYRETTGTSPTRTTQTLAEIVEEIKKILKEAWTRSKEERNSVRKRLYLRWHPDKNPDQVDLCTEVCQIIQHLIQRLDNNLPIDDYNVERESPTAQSSGTGHNAPDFDDYFDRMRERARRYRSQEEKYYDRYSSRSGSGGSHSSRNDYEDFFRGFTHQSNPQPEEARRWMRQAEHNLQSSVNDGSATAHPSYDWMCVKCYEAAKIAVRAVKYARDANTATGLNESLILLSFGINDAVLSLLAGEMERLVVSLDRLKYPSSLNIPKIPGEVYCEDTANKAFCICRKILDRCSQLVGSVNE